MHTPAAAPLDGMVLIANLMLMTATLTHAPIQLAVSTTWMFSCAIAMQATQAITAKTKSTSVCHTHVQMGELVRMK
jgi:hypothetical protein